MHAGSFGVKNAGIEQPTLSAGAAINDHSSKIAQTAHALSGVFATQHFKDNIRLGLDLVVLIVQRIRKGSFVAEAPKSGK